MDENSTPNINFIPCIRWVKRGVANANPMSVKLSKNELVQLIKDTKQNLSLEQNENEVSTEGASSTTNYNFENYDNDDDVDTAAVLGISSLAELPTEAEDHFSDSDDSEIEDDKIIPTDNLILVGHVEGHASMIDVYIYNAQEISLYVHHDIILSSFPLCLEWLNFEPRMSAGNYCAVGSMSSTIEVWDIDMINAVEPSFTLGKPGSRRKNRPLVGHTDAVLSLAWNQLYEHVIASGSVDKSILLWDMETQKPSNTIKAFENKVQCLEWHNLEAQMLLGGGCDKTARIFDCRNTNTFQTWQLDGEAERAIWNPLEPYMFLVGTDKGTIQGFDCRKGQLWSLEAHSKEVTGLVISGQCPGLLVTSSLGKSVKTWDLPADGIPKLVYEKEYLIGDIHCLELCPDSPFVIAAGGENPSGNLAVYDLQNISEVHDTFSSRELVQLVPETNTGEMSSADMTV